MISPRIFPPDMVTVFEFADLSILYPPAILLNAPTVPFSIIILLFSEFSIELKPPYINCGYIAILYGYFIIF